MSLAVMLCNVNFVTKDNCTGEKKWRVFSSEGWESNSYKFIKKFQSTISFDDSPTSAALHFVN